MSEFYARIISEVLNKDHVMANFTIGGYAVIEMTICISYSAPSTLVYYFITSELWYFLEVLLNDCMILYWHLYDVTYPMCCSTVVWFYVLILSS